MNIDIAQYEIGCARYVDGQPRPVLDSDQRKAWDDMEAARIASAKFRAGNGEYVDVCWESMGDTTPVRLSNSVRCF